MSQQRKRSTDNTNHIHYYQPTYEPEQGISLPVSNGKGPLVKSYLDTTYRVFKNAMQDHGRVLVIRCELYLPRNRPLPDNVHTNEIIRKFVASFKSKVKADMYRKNSPHKPAVRYVIAREYSRYNRPHYHVALFLNGHAYYTLGTFDYRNNLFWRIAEAWGSALEISTEEAKARVYYNWGNRGVSFYRLNPEDDYMNLPAAFKHTSYLCKAATKRFGSGHRGLLASQN
ncbi:YagK/YfjJ domain-containing protein [Halomonas sp. FME65]|nr:inovirus-type Gp2 protein [Halomonas sp. FME65]